MYEVRSSRTALSSLAGKRNILQAGANTVNNSPGLLAPAPSAGRAPSQPIVNVTTRSFFVLTAASGSLTRTMNTGDNITTGAILTLNSIDQQVTWYSGAPHLPYQQDPPPQGSTGLIRRVPVRISHCGQVPFTVSWSCEKTDKCCIPC